MNLCQNCGHENHKTKIVCIKCGSLLGDTSHKQQHEDEKEQLRRILEQI